MPDLMDVYRGKIPRLPRREVSDKKIQEKREQLAMMSESSLEEKLIEYARNVFAQKNEDSELMQQAQADIDFPYSEQPEKIDEVIQNLLRANYAPNDEKVKDLVKIAWTLIKSGQKVGGEPHYFKTEQAIEIFTEV